MYAIPVSYFSNIYTERHSLSLFCHKVLFKGLEPVESNALWTGE